MTKVQIKPLSVNACYTGQRFATPALKAYKTELLWKLPNKVIPEPPLFIALTFGFSNKLQDIDGAVKNFLDALQDKYKFNDRDVYEMHLKKVIVPKGSEFVEFEITPSPASTR